MGQFIHLAEEGLTSHTSSSVCLNTCGNTHSLAEWQQTTRTNYQAPCTCTQPRTFSL
jgi:hypothetical protein